MSLAIREVSTAPAWEKCRADDSVMCTPAALACWPLFLWSVRSSIFCGREIKASSPKSGRLFSESSTAVAEPDRPRKL